MNGLNSKRWKMVLIIFSLSYLISGSILLILLFNYSNNYSKKNLDYIEEVKIKVNDTIDKNELDDIDFQEFLKESPLELLVWNDQDVIYRTHEYLTFENFNKEINANAVIYQGVYDYKTIDNKDYIIALAIYPQSFENGFVNLIIVISILVTIIYISIFFVLFILRNEMLKPISRLKILIEKLMKFEFGKSADTVEKRDDYDALSLALSEFSETMDEKIDTYEVNYTQLEKQLQAKNELNTYKTQLIGSLIHDLKTPMNIILLQLDKVALQDKNNIDISKMLKAESESVIKSVNEILKIANRNEETPRQVKEFDIVKIVKQLIKNFQPLAEKKDLFISVDMPLSLEVKMDFIECKMILHNILSNAIYYSPEDSEIEFELYVENGLLNIRCYNDAEISNIDFEHVFDLFYSLEKPESMNQGSGVGMYTIKNMINLYGGTCEFYPVNNGVLLAASIPNVTLQEE